MVSRLVWGQENGRSVLPIRTIKYIEVSYNGSTAGFGPAGRGSIPFTSSINIRFSSAVDHLVDQLTVNQWRKPMLVRVQPVELNLIGCY